ncbi:hypothetical protein DPEC_G00333180 [Dallia pectoralis]|uniref:Uncharacterized protein n=1 Tax=Dallia pectoralis TaxID=75939 RepID=A0ACC2F6A3_DALPE|nr:hypothetical protein DPEC_G00333180 [Dallia pectoralis]
MFQFRLESVAGSFGSCQCQAKTKPYGRAVPSGAMTRPTLCPSTRHTATDVPYVAPMRPSPSPPPVSPTSPIKTFLRPALMRQCLSSVNAGQSQVYHGFLTPTSSPHNVLPQPSHQSTGPLHPDFLITT